MRTFTDKDGTDWTIELDIGVVMRIANADERFALLAPTALLDKSDEKSQLQMRLADIRHAGMLFELLWQLCKEQAAARSVNAEQFAKLITPSLLKARRAFFDEWRDFFHSLQQTGEAWMLEELIAEMEQVETEVKAKVDSKEMAEVRAKARAKITDELNKSFGGTLATLESTLALTPGDS